MMVLVVAFGFWPAVLITRANCCIESIEIVQPSGVAMTQMSLSVSVASTVSVGPSTRAIDVLRDNPMEMTVPSPAPIMTPSDVCDGVSVDVAAKDPSRRTLPLAAVKAGQNCLYAAHKGDPGSCRQMFA